MISFTVQGQPRTANFRLTARSPEGEALAERLGAFLQEQTRLFDTLVLANDTVLDRHHENPDRVRVGDIEAGLRTDAEGATLVSEAKFSNLAAPRPPHWRDDIEYKLLPCGTQQWQRTTMNRPDLPRRETIRYNAVQGTLSVLY